jgi:mannose-1-phosphate guanylyltransferase
LNQINRRDRTLVEHVYHRQRAAIILAGGDGVRLSPFTRRIFGYQLPKQFCPWFEGETLLEQTMRRVSIVAPLSRTITVLNRVHERFYSPLVPGIAPRNLLIQPENRGTAPAILGALLRLVEAGYTGTVAILPSDHYVSDDGKFMAHVATAFAAVELSARLIVFFGVPPEGPETEYGWIEPGAPVAGAHSSFKRIVWIRRFLEKTSPELAEELYAGGCLWNSFVFVANTANLLTLFAQALPALFASFARIRALIGTAGEREILEAVYGELKAVNFSDRVLAEFPTALAVLPIKGVKWSDLGEARRLLAVMSRSGLRPQWLDKLQT